MYVCIICLRGKTGDSYLKYRFIYKKIYTLGATSAGITLNSHLVSTYMIQELLTGAHFSFIVSFLADSVVS